MSNSGYIFLSFLVFVMLLGFHESDTQIKKVKESIIKLEKHKHQFKDGDLLFQRSTSDQSKAIQLATGSKFSHVGILYKTKNKFYVLEAVQPVQLTSLEKWIAKGEDNKYVVKRLKKSEKLNLLDEEQFGAKLKTKGQQYLGKNYDTQFEWSDSRMYCSELVWKIYRNGVGVELTSLSKFDQFDLTTSHVKEKIKERFDDNIPFNEPLVTPGDLFQSEKLELVYQN